MNNRVLTVSQMKEWEAQQDNNGISYAQLMENAGTGVAKDLMRRFSRREVVVLCGKGNNAGDGLVLARILAQHGWTVYVLWLQGQHLSALAQMNHQLLPVSVRTVDITELNLILSHAPLVVDAVYGTGFRGTLPFEIKQCFATVNNSAAVTLALDLPSGVAGDGDVIADGSFQAQLTYVFHALKPAHCLAEVAALCGEIMTIDLVS